MEVGLAEQAGGCRGGRRGVGDMGSEGAMQGRDVVRPGG